MKKAKVPKQLARGEQHKRRSSRWRNLLGPKSLMVFNHVEKIFVRELEAAGFCRVDVCFGQDDLPAGGNEFWLERQRGEIIDAIEILFDKYLRPKFQVRLSQNRKSEPGRPVNLGDTISYASVVKRSGQYCYFWGKPWWMPKFMWSERKSEYVMKSLCGHIEQILHFFDTGNRGPNISQDYRSLR